MAEKTSTQASSRTAPQTTGRAPEAPILSWEAQEFVQYERGSRWYTTAGLTGGLLVVAMVFLQQWIAVAVFALATFVVMKHAEDTPRTLTHSISTLGIYLDDDFIPYQELKAYWIVYKPPLRSLTLQTTGRFKPVRKANLGEVDPGTIRDALRPYLPERPKQGEDFLDRFSRFIRL